MLPIFASALADIAVNAIKSLLPETPEDKLEVLRLQIQQQAMDNALLTGQMAVNAEEAKSESLFVSGGRPALIWICDAGFAWQFVVQPILIFIGAVFHYNIPVPAFDTTTMVSALFGLMGMSYMRSQDKRKGVQL